MDSPLFWLLVALSVPTTSIAHHGQVNLRSSWWQLIAMLQCSTGRSYSYNGYGCYCGLGGRGWPVDRMDWCCFNHDCCYRKAEAAGCRPKTQSYNWSCNRSTPSCWANNSRCQKRSCECDVVLSKCLKWANYQNKYAYYSNFLCGNSEPKC